MLELDEQRQVDAGQRDHEHDGEILEPLQLLCSLPSDLQLIALRKTLPESIQSGLDRREDLRREDARRREAQDRQGPKVFASSNPRRFQNAFERRHREQGNFDVLL